MAFPQSPDVDSQAQDSQAHDPIARRNGAHFETALRRPTVPAWALSMLLHVAVFFSLTLVLRTVPKGIDGEPDRTTGIALVREAAGEPQYVLDAQESSGRRKNDSAAFASSLADTLPSAAEMQIDLSGVLPTGVAGPSDSETGGIGDLSGALESSQRTELSGGDISTSVFGVQGSGTRFVYVFDRSGSMDGFGGAPLRAAKAELLASLEDLQRTHQFQIIFYNERPRVFNPTGGEPELVYGDTAGKELAKRFVQGITANGGTRHMQALRLALGMRADVVFFLTDADEPQMTEDELRRIRRLNYGTAIHAIEFGFGPKRSNINFLKRLAAQNQGQHIYVDVAKLRQKR